MRKHRGRYSGGFGQNIGAAGVVYILENDGLRVGWFKIGCSTRSGHVRARELNIDANTGTPGSFRCVFEARTLDCGLAEKRVFKELGGHRRGKFGQEFFEVGLARAQEVILRICAEIDEASTPRPSPPSRADLPRKSAPQVVAPPDVIVADGPAPHAVATATGSSPIRLRWILAGLVLGGIFWANSDKSTRADASSRATLPSAKAPTVAAKSSVQLPQSPAPSVGTLGLRKDPAPGMLGAQPAARSPLATLTLPDAPSSAGSVARSTASAGSITRQSPNAAQPQATQEDATSRTEEPGKGAGDADRLRSTIPRLAKADLRRDELASLEAACASAKYNSGPVAYLQCVQHQLDDLATSPRNHTLAVLTSGERQSLDAACSSEKYNHGPAALNRCIERQLALLAQTPLTRDVSALTAEERVSLDSACSHDKYNRGPAAYNACRERMLAALDTSPSPVDLSGLTQAERTSMSAACSHARYNLGPASLRDCNAKQYEKLRDAPAPIDLKQFPRDIRTSIESACANAKYTLGPADYNRCVERQVTSLETATARGAR